MKKTAENLYQSKLEISFEKKEPYFQSAACFSEEGKALVDKKGILKEKP